MDTEFESDNTGRAQARSNNNNFDALELFKSAKNSVVDITSITHWGIVPTGVGFGKGFFLEDPQKKPDEKSCLLVTDNHVLDDNSWNSIKTSNGKSLSATVDYRDKESDLAFLKINNVEKPEQLCPPLQLSDSSVSDKLGIVARGGEEKLYYYGQAIEMGRRSQFGAELQNGENPDRELLIIAASGGKGGDSGAPFLNQDGKVDGIIAGGNGWRVYATPAESIKHALISRSENRQTH